jgi:hypothetical protein
MATLFVLNSSTIAAADPPPPPPPAIAITASKQTHSSYPTVTRGGPGFAALWEEKKSTGQDARHIAAAILDASAKVVVGPTRLFDGGALPNDVNAVWNGKTFTVVVCNGAWPDKPKVAWGELGTEGKFIMLGEQAFAEARTDGFGCDAPILVGTSVTFAIIDRADAYNDDDERTSHTCRTRRATIDGGKLALGKPTKLCDVTAASDAAMFGRDDKDRPAVVDSKGKLNSLKELDAHGAVFVRGKLAVGTGNDAGGLAIAWVDPPYRRVARTQPLDRSPIGSVQEPKLLALSDGNIAAYTRTPKGLELAIFDDKGKPAWQGVIAGSRVQYSACTADDTAVVCVWTDDD